MYKEITILTLHHRRKHSEIRPEVDPKIGSSTTNWAQQSSFYLMIDTKSRNYGFIYTRTINNVQE